MNTLLCMLLEQESCGTRNGFIVHRIAQTRRIASNYHLYKSGFNLKSWPG